MTASNEDGELYTRRIAKHIFRFGELFARSEQEISIFLYFFDAEQSCPTSSLLEKCQGGTKIRDVVALVHNASTVNSDHVS